MSNIYRDVTLNQVSEQDIGKTIRVAGWVENIRDHGGVSFIDLRDMYAVMQIVIRDGKLLEGIRKEQAITVEGLIEKRDEETYNPKIPTGTIELDAKEVTVLGEVYSQLPFEVMTRPLVRSSPRTPASSSSTPSRACSQRTDSAPSSSRTSTSTLARSTTRRLSNLKRLTLTRFTNGRSY